MKKQLLTFIGIFFITVISYSQTTYVWSGGSTGDYQVAGNWTPTRTTPSTSDILSFTSNATVTNVLTQSISQLKLSSNAVVSLQAQSGASRTLTVGINNPSGDDIDIPSGCELILAQNASGTATETFTIILTSTQASATANIAGSLTIFKNTTTSFNNVFNVANGTTTISGTVNNAGSLSNATATKLVFSDGSTYNHLRDNGTFPPGGNFTGANINVTGFLTGTVSNFPSSIKSLTWNCVSQPTNITATLSSSTLVSSSTSLAISGDVNILSTGSGAGALVFNLSTVTVGGNMLISANGFDFSRVATGNTSNFTVTGNLTINNVSTRNVNGLTTGGGTSNLTVNDFIQTGAGNFVLASASATGGTSNLIIKGNFNKAAGTFTTTSTPGITGNVVFSGTSSQTISTNTAFSNAPNLEINNANGVSLSTNFTSPGVTKLTSGFLAINGNTLTLNGTVTGSGVIRGNASSNLSIGGTGALGTLNFDQTTPSTTNAINNFTINRTTSGTVSLGNALNLIGVLTSTAGALTTNDNLTLISNATSTARIANILGSITGNVTVQRYIPEGRRTSRFLGHPFSTTLTMASLIDNIYVTGGNYLTGFDSTGTQSPSSFWFDNGVDQAWKAFTTTSDASWAQYRGIRVLVRGDRTQTATLTSTTPPTPNAVTLDMTGTLNTGPQNITVTTGYSVLGNPYPSPVNLGARLFATTNIGTLFWYWDANAGPTAGAYRTRLIGAAENSTLPMSGAFVVQPAAATSIAFVEADKVATDSTNLFRTSTQSGVLELQVLYNNYPADNLYVRFNNSANDQKDALDGVKLTNPEVNFYALSADKQKLSLDTRVFSNNKIIPLGFTATAANTFTIKAADLGIAEEVYLRDQLLNIETKLDAITTYTFSVDPANAATVGENRFELVFRTSAALPTNFVNVAAQQKDAAIEVTFNTANETNMLSYEVEESKDGSNFTKGTTLEAKNAATNNYSWLDVTVNNGNNYYRVKAIEKNGAVKYSQVVRVNIGTKRSEFTVYPNPVKGGTINLQLTDIEKGVYTIKVVNNLGQEIAAKKINHNGGSATQTIDLGKGIASGSYNMQITNGTTVITKTVIVE